MSPIQAAVQKMVLEVEETLCSADLLVNNAGLVVQSVPPGRLTPMTGGDAWKSICEDRCSGLKGGFAGNDRTWHWSDRQRLQRGGDVRHPLPGDNVTSKTALIRFTEILALETGQHGVKVFAIEPGTVRTAMAELRWNQKQDSGGCPGSVRFSSKVMMCPPLMLLTS